MSKNKIIIIASSIIGLLVLLLIVLWLMSMFSHKYYTYEEVEEKMIAATDAFYKKNPQILPVENGRSVLSYNTLVENDCIKPLNELLKDGDSCTAEMGIIKNENDYTYIPKLVCSDKYSTIELAQHIISTHEVVTSGSGLYSDGQGGYYFRGKVTDNYIALGTYSTKSGKEINDILWQIISIDKDGKIKMKSLYSPSKVIYDNRYNETEHKNIGYNDFEMSLLKDSLKKLETDETFLTNEQRSKLVKTKLCLGKRKLDNTSRDGSVECSILSQDEYTFGLIYPYEYIRASIDENCKTMTSRSCQNYNLLTNKNGYVEWTTLPNPENNYGVYTFDGIGFEPEFANKSNYLFVTAYLNSYTIFKSGDGSFENPYKLFK